MDRSSRDRLSEKAASIVAGIQDGAQRQEVIEKLNEILTGAYAPRLDLSGAVQRTVGKISSQAKKLGGSRNERVETPPPSYFEDRLEDFQKACRFKNNKLMNEIIEAFEPGSEERLQLETMRTLVEEEQIRFELEALLHDQVSRISEAEQKKIVEKAQRVVDRAPENIQDEVFKRLFILFRPLMYSDKIRHPKGAECEKELFIGFSTVSSWQKKAEVIKRKYDDFNKDRNKWSLNDLAKLVKEFEKLEEDRATLEVNWRDDHTLSDITDSLSDMRKELWRSIKSRGKTIGKDIEDVEVCSRIRREGEVLLPKTIIGFDSLESWWTTEGIPILEKCILFSKEGQEWTPDQLATFLHEIWGMNQHKYVFSLIDPAPVTQFFDEATVDKIQKTEDAIVEKLKQEYEKQFGKKMRERLVLQILRDGKFPSA